MIGIKKTIKFIGIQIFFLFIEIKLLNFMLLEKNRNCLTLFWIIYNNNKNDDDYNFVI